MLFLKKKKLLEIDKKIDTILERFENERSDINDLNERIAKMEKRQNELASCINDKILFADKQFALMNDKMDSSFREAQTESENICNVLSVLVGEKSLAVIENMVSLKAELCSLINDVSEKTKTDFSANCEKGIHILQKTMKDNSKTICDLIELEGQKITKSENDADEELQKAIRELNEKIVENIDFINEGIKLLLLNSVMNQIQEG